MKKLISLFLSLLLLLTLAACGKDGSDAQIIYPIDAAPDYLDPQIATGSASACIIGACFEGLMTYDENGELVPAAAEKIDVSLGELSYTFHLRKNLRWRVTKLASGVLGEDADKFDKKITAEDFAFGLRRALRPETNSPAAPYLMAIKNAREVRAGTKPESKLGVKVVDDRTLEIKLSRADDGFLAALALPGAMPCDQTYFEATHGRYCLSPEYFICNGPFFLSGWNETAIIVRKERKGMDAYRAPGDVTPASVYFSINNEQATRDTKLVAGTYEATPLTAAQAFALENERDVTVRGFNSATLAVLMNCSDAVLKSSAVRRAVAMTFDPEPLLAATGLPAAGGLVPPACLLGKTSYREKTGAVAGPKGTAKEAKELMQNGMDALDIHDVELTVLCAESLESAVRSVMQQWQSAFGVHFSIVVESLPEDELETRVRAGDYQMALYTLKSENTNALDTLSAYCSDRTNNLVRLKDGNYDALIRAASEATYPKEAVTALQNAEQALIKYAVVLPVAEAKTFLGFGKGVSGIGTNPTGDVLYFKHAAKK